MEEETNISEVEGRMYSSYYASFMQVCVCGGEGRERG